MKANVLVTSSGTIVAQGIIKSLRFSNTQHNNPVEYRIISCDMSPEAVGLYRSDEGFLVPPISSSSYIDSIIKLSNDRDVKAIFPGADEELQVMSNDKEKIERETNAVVITNPSGVIATSQDKWETYKFLKMNNLPCPETSLPEKRAEFLREFGYPVIVKPRDGHGSLYLYLVNSNDEVDHAISMISRNGLRPLLQQYIASEKQEFTTGVTINQDGTHVMSSIAMRRTLKGGQTYKGFIDNYGDVERIAGKVALKLGARGAINIQGRVSNEEFKVIEINPRFSASSPIRAVAGVNEPDIVFRNFVLKERIIVNRHDRIICLRYWNEVYVPYSVFEKLSEQKKLDGEVSFIHEYF